MKKNILITLLLVGTLIVCGVILNAVSVDHNSFFTNKGEGSGMIIRDATFPETFDSVMSYRVVYPEVTNEYVREIMQKYDMHGTPELTQDKTMYYLKDTSSGIVQWLDIWPATGAMLYHIEDSIPKTKPVLPSDEEAGKTAVNFLKVRGLLPSEAGIKGVYTGTSYSRIGKSNNTSDIVWNTTLAVVFKRDLNGLPVFGDDLTVHIGEKNTVTQVGKSWRNLTPDKPVRVKKPEKAWEEFTGGSGLIHWKSEPGAKITITNITVGYYMDDGWVVRQEIVLPVYRFSGTVGGEAYYNYVNATES
jgi:hypothetical protein